MVKFEALKVESYLTVNNGKAYQHNNKCWYAFI